MIKKGIVETDQCMTKEQRILYKALGEAMLKYNRKKKGTVFINDIRILCPTKKDGWGLISFWFKVE